MKKLITLIVMALLFVPVQQADAQGFLKKALSKAKAVMSSQATDEEEEEEQTSNSSSRASRSNSDEDDGGMMAASAKDQLQPKRQSTLTWDEAVVPSTASSAEALMKELPAVPSVAQLIEPDEDIQIVYTGLRPGEKLFEERLMDEEGLTKTSNELISIGKPIPFDEDEFIERLPALFDAAYDDRESDIRGIIESYVSTYKPAGRHGTERKTQAYEKQMMEMLAKRTENL